MVPALRTHRSLWNPCELMWGHPARRPRLDTHFFRHLSTARPPAGKGPKNNTGPSALPTRVPLDPVRQKILIAVGSAPRVSKRNGTPIIHRSRTSGLKGFRRHGPPRPVYGSPWGNSDLEREILEPVGVEVVEAPDAVESTLAALAKDVDAIATCWAKVTENVIAAATRCRIICRMGIGLDNIAIPAATARGIPVTNVPDYCLEEVADHTLALLLALARNVGFFHLRTKRGNTISRRVLRCGASPARRWGFWGSAGSDVAWRRRPAASVCG